MSLVDLVRVGNKAPADWAVFADLEPVFNALSVENVATWVLADVLNVLQSLRVLVELDKAD